jgi:hypothetical protein
MSAFTLEPARWIWLPSQRCLPNTTVLFRKILSLDAAVVEARGYLAADSRYRMWINGQFVQRGPAPCDPRWQDADPLDLSALLLPGQNVIGIEVLYYGSGDGTWPMGSPGLLFNLEVTLHTGERVSCISDASWHCLLNRAMPPGMPKQWYLRALQEVFDAREHPYGWKMRSYALDTHWLHARELPGAPHMPALFAGGPEYVLAADLPHDLTAQVMVPERGNFGLRPRTIPFMLESVITAERMTTCGRVTWRRDPADWFESRIPDSFTIASEPVCERVEDGWRLPATPARSGWFATFALPTEVVGFPMFDIEAPAGTIIELMTQESHDDSKALWLDSHFYHWSRVICRAGVTRFAAWDYEAVRWLQLHVRNANGPVTIRRVGVRRRQYPWPHEAQINVAGTALQRLIDASINTLHNSAQETIMDGAGRERQQYSGDCGHQAQVLRYAFGETRLPARYLITFSQGLTYDGYFLDTWPAFDRLARITQRQLGATQWGPILDHGLQFVSDCWQHYVESGDRDALMEPYPRLLRFKDYLQQLVRRDDDLLPVVNIGIPAVWLDHDAYHNQRDKQCAFNLQAVVALKHLAQIAKLFTDAASARHATALADSLLRATLAKFWDRDTQTFVINKPWLAEDGARRMCDRSLALTVLFDLVKDWRVCGEVLAGCPLEMGFSYPANAGWRLRALVKAGRADIVVRELRERWANLDSVRENLTLQETWQVHTDGTVQYSHCPIAPLQVLFLDLLGLQPLVPGFARYELRPQLADLGDVDVTMHTPQGRVRVQCAEHRLTVYPSPTGIGRLVLGDKQIKLPAGGVLTRDL